jgi:hypothetical protein
VHRKFDPIILDQETFELAAIDFSVKVAYIVLSRAMDQCPFIEMSKGMFGPISYVQKRT